MSTTGSSRSFTNPRWSLQGMRNLVTGGTRGIGRAVVEELGGLGAEIHTCSRNEAGLMECLRGWNSKGILVTGSVCDVSISEQRVSLIKEVESRYQGKLDILVNNVGTIIRKPTTEYSSEECSKIIATNFDSAFHLSQLAHHFSNLWEEEALCSFPLLLEQLINLRKIWLVSGLRTISGRIVSHPGTSKPRSMNV